MRMGLPATSPNNLGLILALNLYFCTVAARRVDGILKRMLPYAIALTFLALLLTFSRSSVLLYLVALALLLVFKDIHIPARTWGWAGTVGAIVLATGIAGIVAVNPDIADNVSHWIELNLSGDDPSMQGHIKTFKEAWERLPEYYLHGFEKGTVGPNAIFFTLSINHVENTILGVIYDMGFFLGFFFLLGWGLTLSHFHQQRRQYAAFWGFFVCSQFLPYFFGADALIVFAYLYALSGLMHDSRVST